MIFNVPMSERKFFRVYGGGVGELIYSTVFVDSDAEAWTRLWHVLTTIKEMRVGLADSTLMETYQRVAIGLTLALNPEPNS